MVPLVFWFVGTPGLISWTCKERTQLICNFEYFESTSVSWVLLRAGADTAGLPDIISAESAPRSKFKHCTMAQPDTCKQLFDILLLFSLISQRQLKSIQETTQMIILAKIKLRFPSIVNHLLIINFEMVWNEITTTEKMKQKLLFCSKLSVLHTIYQNIFWNTNFKTSRENFFV